MSVDVTIHIIFLLPYQRGSVQFYVPEIKLCLAVLLNKCKLKWLKKLSKSNNK